jgi:cytochrome b561
LLIIRVAKRFVRRDPLPIQDIKGWQQKLAKMVQLGLYCAMIAVPLTGYLSARFHQLPVKVFGYFNINQSSTQSGEQGWFEWLRACHEVSIQLLMVLLVVHIGAAVFHRLVLKDQVLASMVSSGK